jgi:hypothetical protein
MFQVLPHLPWWRQPADVHPRKLALAGMAKLAGNYEPLMFQEAAFMLPPRASKAVSPALHPLAMPPLAASAGGGGGGGMVKAVGMEFRHGIDVKQLIAIFDSGQGSEHCCRSAYWAGWLWRCQLQWKGSGSAGKTLGVYVAVLSPLLLGLVGFGPGMEALGVTADIKLSIGNSKAQKHVHRMFHSSVCIGFVDMQLVPPVQTASAVEAALGPHLRDGLLPVTLEVSNVL